MVFPLTAAQLSVITWLRSPEGSRWSRDRIRDACEDPMIRALGGTLARHDEDDGVFATVIPDEEGGYGNHSASWPVPFDGDSLDDVEGPEGDRPWSQLGTDILGDIRAIGLQPSGLS